MKRNISIVTIVALALFLSASCSDSFLDVINPTGEPLEEYYTTDDALNEAVTAAYAPLHWPDWDGTAYNDLTCDAEILGDDFWVGGSSITDNQHWHMLFNYEANSNNTLETLWTDFYSGIKRCNDVIKYCSWGGGTEDNRNLYTAQARVLRVYYYNILWHYYGNVPFYLENLESPYTAPQLTADEIYDQLVVEMEEIIADGYLPMKWDNTNAGRVSQAMLYMIYAEMVMYQNDTDRYSKALGYMNEIIESGEYSLMADYAAIWEETGEFCSESIFEITYEDGEAQRDWGTSMYAGGSVLPTLISPNGFPGDDLWSAGSDGWGFLPLRTETRDMFEDGDARKAATVWDCTEYSYTERYQDTHLWLNKYRPTDANCADCPSSKNLNYNNNKRIYRYSETLLNAAELLLYTGGSTATALNYLNQVASRAGASTYSAVNIDNLLNERHLEFVGEGKRYFDLVRTGYATTYLIPDSYGYRTNTWSESKKHIPLSQSELDADPSLVQNNY